MLYEGYKVYGPYTRKDGRKHVILINSCNERTTVSYPRYLMELHIGRYLTNTEEVHHVDEDYTNDEIDNLEIKDGTQHRQDHAKEVFELFVCPECEKIFEITDNKKLNEIVQNRRKGKLGPFCSRRCAGKYNSPKRY